ncbi:Hsp33 family molecular chaperone [Microvirga sp. W0021]|uniref:Hsp33 family molecular chaperone n=1 Tax=Hohaiivirga grylli TaxID=3133970 RepID=A0ABV0BG35_9HYPH
MSDNAKDDIVIPFSVEPLAVRGRVVRLGDTISAILDRHHYPDAVSRVVGEAAALTVLLGSALKFEGQFQLQTKTDGPVDMIVIDFHTPDCIRAYARFDKEAIAKLGNGPHTTADVIGRGILGMTVDQGSDMNRYQGIVSLQGTGFEEAAQEYFDKSEQLQTKVRLAVAESVTGGARQFCAGGLMVQYLPSSTDKLRLEDPEALAAGEGAELWDEANALVSTIEDHELVDPNLPSEQLLYRLFHERGVVAFPGQTIREACTCSEERVLSMIQQFSATDAETLLDDDGQINVSCEFCSRQYHFKPEDIGISIPKA